MTGASTPSSLRWVVARPVVQFTLIGLAAVALVGAATSVASRRVGEREAITDARTTTLVKAQGRVEPVITDGLVARDPDAVRSVGDVVERDVLDDSLVRVKIWTSTGEIVYSDERRLVGARYALGDDELAALRGGLIEAEVSDLTKPENRFERSFGKLLEVYLPIVTPGGDRLLFEAYYRYDTVAASGSRIWRSFAPISLGALVLLEVLQIPLAWSLARRLQHRQRVQEALLRRALDASDIERRRVASDLHDGPVQALAGVAFSLAGAARDASVAGTPASTLLDSAAGSIRSTITELRSMLVDIYPADLDGPGGVAAALADLADGVAATGVSVSLDTERLASDELPASARALLYRTAREALRNVAAHAGATSVTVVAESDAERACVSVTDDGAGFSPEDAASAASSGHFGLRGLAGLARDAGATLTVDAAPGRGTLVRMEVPLS
jgi:signal transduction histidine kinase